VLPFVSQMEVASTSIRKAMSDMTYSFLSLKWLGFFLWGMRWLHEVSENLGLYEGVSKSFRTESITK